MAFDPTQPWWVSCAPPSGLTTDANAITQDVPIPAGVSTPALTTNSLAVGTWIITLAVTLLNLSGSTTKWEALLGFGTAQGTILGGDSSSGGALNNGIWITPTIDVIVKITQAGTLAVNVLAVQALTAKAVSGSTGSANATGYSAVKIV